MPSAIAGYDDDVRVHPSPLSLTHSSPRLSGIQVFISSNIPMNSFHSAIVSCGKQRPSFVIRFATSNSSRTCSPGVPSLSLDRKSIVPAQSATNDTRKYRS